MRFFGVLAGLFMGATLLAPSAGAATISGTLSFTASGFEAGAPVDPVTGSFDFSFDPTQIYVGDQTVISNFVSNIAFSGPINFSYVPILGGSFGGANLTSLGLGTGTDDFRVLFSSLFNFTGFAYTQVGAGDRYHAGNVTFALVPPTATPIPGSVLMLLTAFAGLAGLYYVRARKTEAGAFAIAA